jgi:hypothetical protein
MVDQYLIEILNQLRLDSTPPLVIHSDDALFTVYVIYKLQNIGVSNGYPILKVVSSTGTGFSTDIVTRGFMLYSPLFDVLVYNNSLKTALNTVSFG